MPASHAHTVGVAANHASPEEEEVDICPTCDFECTCKPRPAPSVGITIPASSSSHANSSAEPKNIPTLKIKLTVPTSMLGKRRTIASITETKYKKTADMSDDDGELSAAGPSHVPRAGRSHSSITAIPMIPKRRGRPPKATKTAPNSKSRIVGTEVTPSSLSQKGQNQPPASKGVRSAVSKSKVKGTIGRRGSAGTKRRRMATESESSDDEVKEDDDAQSVQFPTFVSASAISSASDDSDSSLSDFDTDSSTKEEEENFILADEGRTRNNSRGRRELFGDENARRKDPQNNWVIRTRQKSVGASDLEMGGTSDDATADEEDEEDADAEEDEAEEDEADGRHRYPMYTGLATGWSDDEESSFDADLFFANLSDTSDDDLNKDDAMVEDPATPSNAMPIAEDPSSDFDMPEGWDGQIMFTVGLKAGQGILDIGFEADAARMLAESTPSISQESDVDMATSECADGYVEDDEDDDGDDSNGNTTEEELVGPDGLPTAQALMLFEIPPSVSAIDPLSTISPTASPTRRPIRFFPASPPTPADILSGRVRWDDFDDIIDATMSGSQSLSSSRGGAPIMGKFEPEDETYQKMAIIDGSNKDIPSPFPRTRRQFGRSRSEKRISGGLSKRGRALSRTTSVLSRSSRSLETRDMSPSPDPPAIAIGLHEVLDASFLDSDPSEGECMHGEGSSWKHAKSLNRWDLIPVGAFRQTRETSVILADASSAGWPDTHRSEALAMEPLLSVPSVRWEDDVPEVSMDAEGSSHVDLAVPSPTDDGACTPTNQSWDPILHSSSSSSPQAASPHPSPSTTMDAQQPQDSQKTRKESKREKKPPKRKSAGIMHLQFQHPQRHSHHQHHHHHHLPNMKSRSSGSIQRTNSSTSNALPFSP